MNALTFALADALGPLSTANGMLMGEEAAVLPWKADVVAARKALNLNFGNVTNLFDRDPAPLASAANHDVLGRFFNVGARVKS